MAVYDPSAGFVTGAGWIDSPTGACATDPGLTGKVHFAFVSRYAKGATVPTGKTDFRFDAAGVDVTPSSYQWLVVNQGGSNVQFKGTGTVNGVDGCGSQIWATDGSPDTFRIKITDGSGSTVYDNGHGEPLGGGSIVVHSRYGTRPNPASRWHCGASPLMQHE